MQSWLCMGCLMAMSWTDGPNRSSEAGRPARAAVAIITGADAPPIEQFAADELAGYLTKLYRIEAARPTSPDGYRGTLFLIGSPSTNSHIRKALGHKGWPQISDQGIVLKRVRYANLPALVIGGGSPAATLWAVYELVERWGVTYLLHGDVLPVDPDPQAAVALTVPADDVAMEPVLPVRWWRTVGELPCGPESWGLADYRIVLGQLAKMKFNRVLLSLSPWQPFLDPEVNGVRRKTAYLWFDCHYPITDDMPGRRTFGDVEEFWNPDLPRGAPCDEFVQAGIAHCRGIIALARKLGMRCGVTANLTEYPNEFGEVLDDPQPVHQLASPTVGPGPTTPIDDAKLTELASAFLKTTVDTYPECDWVMLDMPEFRAWSDHYETAWKALDAKYAIERICPLATALDRAGKRTDYPGGADRALQEVKGDIVALYACDRLINDLGALKETQRPDVKIVYMNAAEELFPVLHKLVPDGGELLNAVDDTAGRIAKRSDVLERLPGKHVPAGLIFSLHDDHVGLLPQLATGSFDTLLDVMIPAGWSGFSTRYGLIGDHNLSVGYVARRAWEPHLDRHTFYERQLQSVCGERAVEAMTQAMRKLEDLTLALDDQGLGLTFPVPDLIMKFWKPGDLPDYLVQARTDYEQAMNLVRQADRARRATLGQADSRARSAAADDYIGYWMGRFVFGAGYIDTIEIVHQTADAEAEAKKLAKTGPAEKHRQKLTEAAKLADRAERIARQTIDAYAHVARDQSDRGAVAVLAATVWRPLRDKARQLHEEANKP